MTRFLSLAVIMMPHAAVQAIIPADDPDDRSAPCRARRTDNEFIHLIARHTKKVNPLEFTIEALGEFVDTNRVDLKCHDTAGGNGYGPEFNGATYPGATALTIASANGNAEVVNFILGRWDGERNPNRRDRRGWTALMAASKNNHEEIVNILLEREGIKVNLQDNLGQTALLRATLFGHTDVVRALLTHDDIDINLQDKSGNTPMWYAKKYKFDDISEMLRGHSNHVAGHQDLHPQDLLS